MANSALAGLAGDPALHRQARRRIVGRAQVELRAAPGTAPRPSRRRAFGVVDDQRGRGASRAASSNL